MTTQQFRTKTVAASAIALAAVFTVTLTSSPGVTAATKAAGAPASCSKKGGTFTDNWNLSSANPEHLDPGLNTELIGAQINNMMFDGLTRADGVTGETKPDVAESWKVSSDGLSWTFKLRKGVKFSSGEDVLPSSFKKSWDLNASPKYASEYAGLAEVIKGSKDVADGKATELGVTADDAAMTLTVNLENPYGLLAERMTHNFFFAKPKEALEKGKDWENSSTVVGNGAFKLDKAEKDQQYKFVRNESYFGGIYGRAACLDAVVMRVSKDPQSAFADFEAGNSQNGIIPVGKFSSATSKYGDKATRAVLSTTWVGFNWRNPEVGGISNSKLRSAIGNAIDRDAINKVVYDNSRRVATGLTPEGIPGFRSALTKNFQSGGANVALAKKQLKEFGKPAPEIRFWFRNNSTESTIAQLVQANLKVVGINVKLEPQPGTGYFGRVRKENPQMFLNGWIWDYAGYDNGANELFHSKDNFDASNNLSDFSAPTFDKLTDAGLKESNPVKSAKLYNQAETFLLNSGVIVPTFHGRFQMVLANNVDFYPQGALGFVEYALVTLK